MKLALSLFSLFLFTSVATATQLPASTFNEGETWMNNQLAIEAQAAPAMTQDWAEMSLADMIDLCLDMQGFWDHSTNMCHMHVSPSMEEVEMMESPDADAMDDEMEAEEVMEMVPAMSGLSNSTFNEGETWFGY